MQSYTVAETFHINLYNIKHVIILVDMIKVTVQCVNIRDKKFRNPHDVH
jgi:hypothetical protein